MKRLLTLLAFLGISLSLLGAAGCGNEKEKPYRIAVVSDLSYDGSGEAEKGREALSSMGSDMTVFLGTLTEISPAETKKFTDAFPGDKVYIAGRKDLEGGNREDFIKVFGSRPISKEKGAYLLLFLPTDGGSKNSPYGISRESMDWLKKELKENPEKPTLIFFEAPLFDTIIPRNAEEGDPAHYAQPGGTLDLIMLTNPQIRLWVSGHTALTPRDSEFASDHNVYHGKVLDLYNSSWNGKEKWTNRISLYKNRILIETYDHQKGEWLKDLTRQIS